MDDQISQ